MKYNTDINSLLSFLIQEGLTAEEALLLYTVYIRTEFPENVDFSKQAKIYYSQFQYYDQGSNPTGIPWSVIIAKLERDGYLITYQGHVQKGKDDTFKVNLTQMEVTDKFKSRIISNNRERLWEYYVEEVYGASLMIDGSLVSTVLPDPGQSYEALQELFWNRCGNGLTGKFEELCQNTLDFFQVFSRNIKISRFLREYEANMMALRAEKKKQASNPWTSSY